MDRQEQIDLIAKWMGWYSREPNEVCWWDREGFERTFMAYRTGPSAFDPFTNPIHCTVVMDEVAKQGGRAFEVGYNAFNKTFWAKIAGSRMFKGPSLMEAFCNALLEAIKGNSQGDV